MYGFNFNLLLQFNRISSSNIAYSPLFFTVCESMWSDIVCIEFTSIHENGLYLQEAGSNF